MIKINEYIESNINDSSNRFQSADFKSKQKIASGTFFVVFYVIFQVIA